MGAPNTFSVLTKIIVGDTLADMSAPLPVRVIDDAAQAVVALQPLRLELLHRLAEPASAASLSAAIGVARQKLSYHLNALLDADLIERVEERRRGNCVEQLFRARARAYVIGAGALGAVAVDPGKVKERFSWAYLIALCARAIRELWVLRTRADEEQRTLATLAVETTIRFRSAADRHAFANEFATMFADLVARYQAPDDDEGARAFRVFAVAHPHLPEESES